MQNYIYSFKICLFIVYKVIGIFTIIVVASCYSRWDSPVNDVINKLNFPPRTENYFRDF